MLRLLLILLLVSCFTPTCFGREWTTASGTYSFEGELVQYVNGHIAVKVSGGKVLNFPEQAYSKADIQYAKDNQSKEDRETDLYLLLAKLMIKRQEQKIKDIKEKQAKLQEQIQESKDRQAAIKAERAERRIQYAQDLSEWLTSKVRSVRRNVKSTYDTLNTYRSMQAHYVVGNLSLIDSLNTKNSQILKHLETSAKALSMKANPTEGWLSDQEKRIKVLINDAAKNEKIIEQETKKIRLVPIPDPT